jgi:hypothetical protein
VCFELFVSLDYPVVITFDFGARLREEKAHEVEALA